MHNITPSYTSIWKSLNESLPIDQQITFLKAELGSLIDENDKKEATEFLKTLTTIETALAKVLKDGSEQIVSIPVGWDINYIQTVNRVVRINKDITCLAYSSKGKFHIWNVAAGLQNYLFFERLGF